MSWFKSNLRSTDELAAEPVDDTKGMTVEMTPTDRSSELLRGLNVVITGAGSGLGEAFATLAASAGASVVVNDINGVNADRTVVAIRAASGVAVADHSDVSTWDGASALIETCVASFGRIDGLVNNAGVITVKAPHEESEVDMRRTIGVNLLGTMFCGTHALRHMFAQGSGSIVNVTSGAQMGMSSVASYAASKGGVASLTYAWAHDAEARGVRVNAISPDARTPLSEEVARQFPGVQAGTMAPASNAAAVLYLLSPRSARVNGQVLLTGGEKLSLLIRQAPRRPALRQNGEWLVDQVALAFETDFLRPG